MGRTQERVTTHPLDPLDADEIAEVTAIVRGYDADALGAGPPRHFPRWLARLFAGEMVVRMGTESRGASNAKAKRELGWELRNPSWRQGFFAAYGSSTPAPARTSGPVAAET